MATKKGFMVVVSVACWLRLIAPTAASVTASSGMAVLCDEVCSANPGCDDSCWATQFDFDQENPPTTCGAYGGSCCGDGVCNPGSEGCNACTDDCGVVDSCPDECFFNNECASGEVCAPNHKCEPATPPEPEQNPSCGGQCTSNSNCCGSDVCIGEAGLKYCGIPDQTYCPDSPACSIPDDCDFRAYCGLFPFTKQMFCDPGIGRCQFYDSPECPSLDNICY